MFHLTFDHYTIKVNDLENSVIFYRDMLGLEEIENRTRKPHIRWFSLGNGTELHLVEGSTREIQTNVGVHLALKLADFNGFLSHLKSRNILHHDSKGRPGGITTRTDGVRQVYFQDPDGYWVEVNEAGELGLS